MGWKIHSFASDRELVEVLAGEISGELQASIARRDCASMAVSGGSTPIRLFSRLSRTEAEWDKVSITLVDERWVPEDSEDSNARLVRSRLLQGRAGYAAFISLKTEQPDPFDAVERVNERLQQLAWPLDIAVLGMGDDGHTASFFAGARGIDAALAPTGAQRCAAVEPANAPHRRMSLTLPALVAARNLYLHIVGDSKRAVLEQATAEGEESQLPIARLLHQPDTTVQIYHAETS